ncbi:MAG: transporter [Legionellaceae bacterium]|nr:transporter [Legionellaceae bacterium]
MKRILIILIVGFVSAQSFAQNISDALRYGQQDLTGTARSTALSGAFGALGGDFYGLSINPAGSAIFLDNHASFTLSVEDVSNKTNLSGSTNEIGSTDFTIGNAGAVFVFGINNENSPWKKFTLGIGYDAQNNLDDELSITGRSVESVGDFFLDQAQGTPLELLQLLDGESISDLYSFLGETEGVAAQNAFLAYQGYIIDPQENSTTQYVSNMGTGSFSKDFYRISDGYQGKYTLNIGTQYGENIFFGINLNSHIIDYRQASYLDETNINTNSSVKRVEFQNTLATIGSGFSAQFGLIAKIQQDFRLGLSYETPTWYTISEETTQYLETSRVQDGETIITVVDPRIINIFSDYKLNTPGSVTASAAYIFGKQGLISIDYEYRDYGNLKFRPANDSYFSNLNALIENNLKASSTIRVGGEYRIQQLSLRAGGHFIESPYQDDSIVGNRTGFSLGLGYNLGNYFMDFAYLRSEQESNKRFYDSGLVDVSNINTVQQQFVFTLGYNL